MLSDLKEMLTKMREKLNYRVFDTFFWYLTPHWAFCFRERLILYL